MTRLAERIRTLKAVRRGRTIPSRTARGASGATCDELLLPSTPTGLADGFGSGSLALPLTPQWIRAGGFTPDGTGGSPVREIDSACRWGLSPWRYRRPGGGMLAYRMESAWVIASLQHPLVRIDKSDSPTVTSALCSRCVSTVRRRGTTPSRSVVA